MRRSSFLSAALAGAASLAAPAVRLSNLAGLADLAGTSRAQVTSLPPGRLALLSGVSLWLLDSNGFSLGEPRRVANGTGGWLQDPAWSPDGERVAFSHVRYSLGSQAAIPWPSAEILTARAAAVGDPALIVQREALNETFVSPVWSPDGNALFTIRRRPLSSDGLSVMVDLIRIDLVGADRVKIPLPGEPLELTVGDDGSLAVVVADAGGTGVTTTRLLRLAPPDYTPLELLNSDQGLGFIIYPRFSRGSRSLLFGAGGGDPPALHSPAFLDALFGRTAAAHGARGWPHVLDLATGALSRAPTEGLDDLVGLSWLDERNVLVLDAAGLAIAELDSGRVLRLPSISGTAFSWHPFL